MKWIVICDWKNWNFEDFWKILKFFENFRKIFFQTLFSKNRAKNFGVFKKILEKSYEYFSVLKRFFKKKLSKDLRSERCGFRVESLLRTSHRSRVLIIGKSVCTVLGYNHSARDDEADDEAKLKTKNCAEVNIWIRTLLIFACTINT